MKIANKIAAATAGFMLAATAQANDFKPAKPADVDVTYDNGELVIKAEMHSCTKDGHMVSIRDGLAYKLNNAPPLSEDHMEAVKNAFADVMTPGLGQYRAVYPSLLSGERFRKQVEEGIIEKLSPEMRTRYEQEKEIAENALLQSASSFEKALRNILPVGSFTDETPIAGLIARGKVTHEPSPYCK